MSRLSLPLLLLLLPLLSPWLGMSGIAAQGDAAEAPAVPAAAKEVVLSGKVSLLGSEAPLTAFHLVFLIKTKTANTRKPAQTDAQGTYQLAAPEGSEVHAFAFGEYAIPPNFSIVTKAAAQGQTFDIFVRPLAFMSISGRVTGPDGQPRPRATVDFALLDMMGDGSFSSFEEPLRVECGKDGRYEIRLAAGFYEVWAYWGDRQTENWDGYFAIKHQQRLFTDTTTLDLRLERSATISGRVIDGRTGEAIECALDVYSGPWLNQRSIYTRPKPTGDEDPLMGTFREELMRIDPEQFTLRFRSIDDNSAMSIYSGLSVTKMANHQDFVLYDSKLSRVDLRLTTKAHQIPMTPGHISVVPTGVVEAEPWLRDVLRLSGYLDGNGGITFWGLPRGDYTIYADNGRSILGFLTVDGSHQSHDVELDFPFLFGHLTYPDGSHAKVGRFSMSVLDAVGNALPTQEEDAFRNEFLSKDARYFIGLGPRNFSYTITFGAPKAGVTEVPWDLEATDLAFISDPIVIKPTEAGSERLDIVLKANPSPRKSTTEE